jgi:hypothetical protein
MQLPDIRLTSAILQDTVEQGTCPFIEISSDSMAPLIRKGDEIQIEAVILKDLSMGDIVVVEDTIGLLAHRYWLNYSHRGEVNLLLKGDSLKDYDHPISSQNLIGRVIARRRNSRILGLTNGLGARLNGFLYRIDSIVIKPPAEMIDVDQSFNPSRSLQEKADPRVNQLASFFAYIVGHTATRIVDFLNFFVIFAQ